MTYTNRKPRNIASKTKKKKKEVVIATYHLGLKLKPYSL